MGILGIASKKKNPPPGGFREFTEYYQHLQSPIVGNNLETDFSTTLHVRGGILKIFTKLSEHMVYQSGVFEFFC